MKQLLVIALVLAGCGADIHEGWELDHDRIIAVRATPPRIAPGEQATIDLLLGSTAEPVAQQPPDAVVVISPPSLANVATTDGERWFITAPDDATLAAAREELALAPDAPVPLLIGVAKQWPYPVTSVDGLTFQATKTIWLGERAVNPVMPNLLINGVDAPDGSELVVPANTKVPLFIDAADPDHIVAWLTSCGEMHDFDVPSAYLVVPPESNQEGELAVVFRDGRGGVAWRVWPIRAE
ncbi:MAG: hypothetical protein SFX73_36210 [Kofleriaceae bacterium]|nr:hypothetical protein [Kofleriaceae bacterium]